MAWPQTPDDLPGKQIPAAFRAITAETEARIAAAMGEIDPAGFQLNASQIVAGVLDRARVPAIRSLGGATNRSYASNDISLSWENSQLVIRVDNTSILNTPIVGLIASADSINNKRDLGNGNFDQTPIFTPYGRGNTVATNYVVAYLNADGRIGYAPSSQRFKQQIADWAPDARLLLGLQLVRFKYTAAVDELGEAAPFDYGLIAEDLEAAGLTELIVYDPEGRPEAIRYDLMWAPLLALARQHDDALRALEARVAALEAG